MTILIIKHGAFGDFVQSLGVIKAIRAHHKDAHITLMTTKPFVSLAESSGYVDSVYVDDRPKWYCLGQWSALRRWLNAQNFDRVYDLQNSERTGAYLKLFKRTPEWNGIAKGASHHFEDNAARKAMHVFDALKAQIFKADIANAAYDDLSWVQADIADLELPERYALIVAGCSPTRLVKRWDPARYVEICAWLHGQGVMPVLIGTKDEADVTSFIQQSCDACVDLTGQTSLFQIVALARGAVCAVGNDTGPIQMIGPTGCQTLGLYPGFSNPVRHGPLGANVRTIQKDTMADITVSSVQEILSEFL